MAANPGPMLSAKVTLSNGASMPRVQLGLYTQRGGMVRRGVRVALEAGYRGFDCSQMYNNERSAGTGICEFLRGRNNKEGVRRESIFYATKLARNSTSYEAVRRSIKDSVNASGLCYVDLFLLHSPYGTRAARLATWRALEDAVADRQVRMIGVSNFGVAHIEELMASNPRIKPVVNQIEVHPFNTRTGIRDACSRHGITVEAYAPLVEWQRMKDSTLVSLSIKYLCSPAQLLIRWSLQHGMVTMPRSFNPDRLVEYGDVANINISETDMEAMDRLDEKLVVTEWDPTDAP